jgi:hypothetical protein
MIEMGVLAKDKVTGFQGIVIGKADYLFGCTQICLTPPVKEQEIKESHWFDEGRIEVLGRGVLPEEVRAEKDGGPQRDCPKGRY